MDAGTVHSQIKAKAHWDIFHDQVQHLINYHRAGKAQGGSALFRGSMISQVAQGCDWSGAYRTRGFWPMTESLAYAMQLGHGIETPTETHRAAIAATHGA